MESSSLMYVTLRANERFSYSFVSSKTRLRSIDYQQNQWSLPCFEMWQLHHG